MSVKVKVKKVKKVRSGSENIYHSGFSIRAAKVPKPHAAVLFAPQEPSGLV